jgi:hypothetical protein
MVGWNKPKCYSSYDWFLRKDALMKALVKHSLWLIVLLLSACNMGSATEAVIPSNTPQAVLSPQPSRTSLPSPTPIPLIQSMPPTAIPPATFAPANPPANPIIVNPNGSITRLLQNGRGLSTGQVMNNGEFQVEGYCRLLNEVYNVAENDVDWFCTYNNQRALTLREQHFTDICRRTYSNGGAFAQLVQTSQVPNERWRCFEYTITVTPTPVRLPVLLQNGIGLSSGSAMNNGNFEVEAYCSAINVSFGVNHDNNFWYCTSNGQRIVTLGAAEFDDICFRTYRVAGAFAIQESNAVPAFGWRCYAYLG